MLRIEKNNHPAGRAQGAARPRQIQIAIILIATLARIDWASSLFLLENSSFDAV
jgi:hypothetical protein